MFEEVRQQVDDEMRCLLANLKAMVAAEAAAKSGECCLNSLFNLSNFRLARDACSFSGCSVVHLRATHAGACLRCCFLPAKGPVLLCCDHARCMLNFSGIPSDCLLLAGKPIGKKKGGKKGGKKEGGKKASGDKKAKGDGKKCGKKGGKKSKDPTVSMSLCKL